jgi:hypothetical protein
MIVESRHGDDASDGFDGHDQAGRIQVINGAALFPRRPKDRPSCMPIHTSDHGIGGHVWAWKRRRGK